MGIESKTTTIENRKIVVTTFPAREGLRVKTKLVKLAAPSIFSLMGAVDTSSAAAKDPTKDSIGSRDVDMSVVGDSIQGLMDRLGEEEIIKLIFEMLRYTKLDGKDIDEELFDVEFAGEYVLLYKILQFVIEVNHFFGKTGIGALRSLMQKKMSKSFPSREELENA